jgi:hypothetical protein
LEQIRNYKKQIDETKKQVYDFKENNNLKKVDDYRRNIVDIKDKLSTMSKEMTHINEQQVDLDMEAEEFPILDELKQYIKPYEELWSLFHEYKEKFEEAW